MGGGIITCWLLTWAIGVSNAWSFFSSMEAVTVFAEDSLCMGDCFDHSGQKMCTFAWNKSMAKCHTTGKPTLRYRTAYDVECLSNCGKFNNEPYEWCATSNSKWDKCSRKKALKAHRTVKSANMYATCKNECSKRGSGYNWCNTVGGSWQHCKPNDFTHTFDYPTVLGKKCAGRCQLYSGDKPYCYTEQSEWTQCYLNPVYNTTLNIFDVNFKSACYSDEYETPGGHKKCKKLHKHRPRKQAPDDHINNEMYFECDTLIDTALASHTRTNPSVVVRVEDPNNMITRDTNPILSYTLLPTISYFTDDTTTVDLPLVLEALVTTHTLQPVGAARDHFTNEVDQNYNNMDRGLAHVNYDERGHILASRLGGPMETFNIFPQAWRMNRGRNSLWYGLEADIDGFLRGHNNRYVRFTAVLSYATDDNHVLVHRPTAVLLRVRAYENNRQVDLSGNLLSTQNPSTTETMYFSNDPDHSCEPLPAMPRRNG